MYVTARLESLQFAGPRFRKFTIDYVGNIKIARPRSRLQDTNFPDWSVTGCQTAKFALCVPKCIRAKNNARLGQKIIMPIQSYRRVVLGSYSGIYLYFQVIIELQEHINYSSHIIIIEFPF